MINLRKAVKTIAGVVMSLTLACAAVPMTMASATTYDNCDVDRNGYVETADLIILNRYLYGQYSVSNYNQLDTNRNLTVDATDSECISAKLTGASYTGRYLSRDLGVLMPTPFVLGFTPNSTSSSSQGREYMRYEYQTGHILTPYTLTPTVINLSSGVSSRAVIGEDTRYSAYGSENTGLVSINNDDGRATGFIIGDHLIATAAHCVYKKGTNIPYHWKRFNINLYDENGCVTSKTLTPVEIHVPSDYVDSDDDTYDYALITVNEDLSKIKDDSILGEDYECVYFSLGTPYNATASAYSNIPIYVTGSPGDLQNTNTPTRLFSAEGRIMNKIENNFSSVHTDVLYYNTDTSGGDSGAPVYTITKNGNKYTYTAIAIHHGGSSDTQNRGSMITNYHLQFYYNNPNISYALSTE